MMKLVVSLLVGIPSRNLSMKPFLLTWLAGAGGINLGFHLQD